MGALNDEHGGAMGLKVLLVLMVTAARVDPGGVDVMVIDGVC